MAYMDNMMRKEFALVNRRLNWRFSDGNPLKNIHKTLRDDFEFRTLLLVAICYCHVMVE